MSSSERLYECLPAVMQARDAERGEPLRALTLLLEEELTRMKESLDTQYDNLFVETCEEWVAPYIGELVRAPTIHGIPEQGISARATVGNALAYRRRKGTLGVVEALADDAADWEGHAVEFGRRLSASQHVNHPRLERTTFPSLRSASDLLDVGGAFDSTMHALEVRSAARGGRFHRGVVGLFVWRMEAQEVGWLDAWPVGSGRFILSNRGGSPMYCNRPSTVTAVAAISTVEEVPERLRRRRLYDDLQLDEGDRHYFGEEPAIRLAFTDGTEIDVDDLVIANLASWWRPPAGKVALDPELGRVCFPVAGAPAGLLAKVNVATVLQVGGGSFDRSAWVDTATITGADLALGLAKGAVGASPDQTFTTVTSAIAAWNDQHSAGQTGVIVVLDSRSYLEPDGGWPTLHLRENATLLIIAGDWIGSETEPAVDAEGPYPLLSGTLRVEGETGSRMVLNGVDLHKLEVLAGELGALELQQARVFKKSLTAPALVVGGAVEGGWNSGVEITLTASVVAGVEVTALEAALTLDSSGIIGVGPDGPSDHTPMRERLAIDAADTDLTVTGSTVVGTLGGRSLEASDSIFDGVTTIERKQTGGVSHCYVAPDSVTPRRYKCQPDAERSEATTSAEARRAERRVRPGFISLDPLHPEFLLLRAAVDPMLRKGASDSGTIGLENQLQDALRRRNLTTLIAEYGPLGTDIAILNVSREFTP